MTATDPPEEEGDGAVSPSDPPQPSADRAATPSAEPARSSSDADLSADAGAEADPTADAGADLSADAGAEAAPTAGAGSDADASAATEADPDASAAAEADPDASATADPDASAGGRSRLKVLMPLAAIAAAVLIATIAIAAGSGSEKLPNNVKRTKSASYAGATVTPIAAAPAIDLPNSLGQRVTLSQYRGKVVLVTFLYTHCPDVCPLIASNLRLVETQLGADAKNVAVIAVSVDPHGDTPKTVAAFLHTHDMTGRMQYLLGSPAQLGRTWKAWNVGSQQDTSDPTLVAHSALVYGISASGKLVTLYPANFNPTDVVHDVRKLAVS